MEQMEEALMLLYELYQEIIVGAWPLWGLMILLILARLLYVYLIYYIEKKRIKDSGMEEVDQMSGDKFKLFLHMHFKIKGYKVKRTPGKDDYGADLILINNGTRIAVQAKRYKMKLGVKAIQEVVAARDYYRRSKAMVVTNSKFSQQAEKLARKNGVELWGRDKLIKELNVRS